MALTKTQISDIMNRAIKAMNRDAIKNRMEMAKTEIIKRTANPLRYIWWRWAPGVTVTVKWPTGWTEQDDLGNQTQSSDPNDHYRPWLEKNVGKQGRDWDWRIGSVNSNEILETDTLLIKVRLGKAKFASHMALMWS